MDIRLENLSIGYKRGRVVSSGINATFRGGELTCLIGANGTGKSTLLKTISGFIPARSGSVWLEDSDSSSSIAAMTHKQMSHLVSIVLTAVPSVQNLTASEMVSMGRSPYTGFWGSLSDNDRQIVEKSLSAVGISRLSGRMIQTLSDGERQKVMIARALAQQTPVILLDEPTAFLDYPSKAELMKFLRQLAHDEGKNIVLSTHDLGLAVRLADRFYEVLSDGLEPISREKITADMASMVRTDD